MQHSPGAGACLHLPSGKEGNMKLVEIIQNGMAQVNAQRTQETLGDRTEYIGASDLGQCPRKVVISKVLVRARHLEPLVG